ncbi:MAG: biotin/lipoyl-binding protein [Chelatococcus sp.]|nr:biotin/lipoyl-binding protein [Chelatococcus sp. YT9]MBX3556697.1 biotin/lipoyl-binding protein [Chelatococcus sp.]
MLRDDLQLLHDLARLQGFTDVAELARYIEPQRSRIGTKPQGPGGPPPRSNPAKIRSTYPRPSKAPPQARLDWRRSARVGFAILAIAVGGGGAWAALAHLDGAAIAPGIIAVESRRKTVQHLEGGLVTSIHVRDGDKVAQGQLLLGLDPTQARASLDMARNQRAAALAEEARLVAERDGTPITLPAEVTERSAVPIVRQAVDDQRHALIRRGSIRATWVLWWWARRRKYSFPRSARSVRRSSASCASSLTTALSRRQAAAAISQPRSSPIPAIYRRRSQGSSGPACRLTC